MLKLMLARTDLALTKAATGGAKELNLSTKYIKRVFCFPALGTRSLINVWI